MSRIDISVRDKESQKLIANRIFCRSSHLSLFCEESQDTQVRDFANTLSIGTDITNDNIEDFLQNLEYTISYLKKVEEGERETVFSFYEEELYIQFLDALENSLVFLQSLCKEQDLQKLEVEIV
jgi:hypothetical protein